MPHLPLSGHLASYSEQGWEGVRAWTLDTGTGVPVFLADYFGNTLTVFAPNGEILWQNLLSPCTRYGFLKLRRVSDWDGGWLPCGVEMARWQAWCATGCAAEISAPVV